MRSFWYSFVLILLFTPLVAAGVITGKVVNSVSSAPVGNTVVYAMRANTADTSTFFAITDQLGNYNLPVPSGQQYYLKAIHPEFNPLAKGPIVLDSSGVARVNFELVPLNTTANYISGLVKNSRTNAAIGNAQVTLYSTSAVGGTYTTYSNAEGRYKFSPVTPGVYRLKASREGYMNYNFPDLISVNAGTQNPNQHIVMVPNDTITVNATVMGRVYKIASTTTQAPLPGAKVMLLAPDSTLYSAVTDSSGIYRIVNVRPGLYSAIVSKEGYQTVTRYPFEVVSGSITADFYLQPNVPAPNVVSGYVKDSRSMLPLQGVTVSLTAPNSASVTMFTYTDAAGKYQFLNIVPGSYRFTASKTGYTTYSRPELLQVTASTQITNLNVALVKQDSTVLSASLTGKTYTTGITTVQVPLPGVKLALFRAGSDIIYRTTYSDSSGAYRFPDLVAGSYSLVCTKEGFQQVTKNGFDLPAGQTILNFTLLPLQTGAGLIKGRVYFDSLNTPVMGAVIDFIPADPNLPVYTTRTSEFGLFSREVMPGRYYVACSMPGTDPTMVYREYYDNVLNLGQATPVLAAAGVPSMDVNFGVPPFPISSFIFTVSGKVADPAGTLLRNAVVRLQPAANTDSTVFSTTTNANGEYAFSILLNRPVSQFPFIVSANREGYLVQYYNNKPAIYLADVLVASPGSSFRNINFALQPVSPVPGAYSISGKVADTLGNPLPGAYVITSQAGTGQVVLSFADSLGNYRTPALRQGTYYVLFAREGFIPQYYNRALTWERATPVKVLNAPVTGINASLLPRVLAAGNGLVAGVVRGQSGEPLAGAMVTVASQNGTVLNYAMSDGLGSYEIAGLEGGTYTVAATLVQFNSLEKTVNYDPTQGNIHKVDFDLVASPTGITEGTTELPVSHLIAAAYPNPFNPAATITYTLPEAGRAVVAVYSMYGAQVALLADGYTNAGTHTVRFDAGGLSSGVYFYTVSLGRYNASGKLVLQK